MSLSIYCSDAPVTNEAIATGILHLKNAFPDKATDTVCAEIMRLAKKYDMGEMQLLDAIDEYIVNHRYNNVTVADILGFDVRVKFYTSKQVFKICGSYGEEKDKELYPRYGLIDGRIYCVSREEVESLPRIQREKIFEKIKQYEDERRQRN